MAPSSGTEGQGMGDIGHGARWREAGISWVGLFAATGTLICCALPILLVTLGLGAAVASLTSSLPLLIWLSLHKAWVFGFSALMLVAAGWVLHRPGRACPTDPETGRICRRTQLWNRRIFWTSVAIWGIGFFFAFLLLPLHRWLET